MSISRKTARLYFARRAGSVARALSRNVSLALSPGAVAALDQNQKPESAGSKARGRGGLAALSRLSLNPRRILQFGANMIAIIFPDF
jgi:hypothetical protein